MYLPYIELGRVRYKTGRLKNISITTNLPCFYYILTWLQTVKFSYLLFTTYLLCIYYEFTIHRTCPSMVYNRKAKNILITMNLPCFYYIFTWLDTVK